MGYYVNYDGHVLVKPHKLADMYEAMCHLNDDDDLKHGGSYGGGSQERWFSWMPSNYPETTSTAMDILNLLGFETVQTEAIDSDDEDGTQNVLRWDLTFSNKIGQESLFLEAMAPFITSGFIEAFGEDAERWAYQFNDGRMKMMVAKITWVDVDSSDRVDSLMGEG